MRRPNVERMRARRPGASQGWQGMCERWSRPVRPSVRRVRRMRRQRTAVREAGVVRCPACSFGYRQGPHYWRTALAGLESGPTMGPMRLCDGEARREPVARGGQIATMTDPYGRDFR